MVFRCEYEALFYILSSVIVVYLRGSVLYACDTVFVLNTLSMDMDHLLRVKGHSGQVCRRMVPGAQSRNSQT